MRRETFARMLGASLCFPSLCWCFSLRYNRKSRPSSLQTRTRGGTGWRFTNHCIENKHLVLYAWVIMTNHIHLAARCDPPGGMSAFLRDFKKFTSKKIVDTIENISESRKEWLLDKFSFEARRTRRPENYKVWKDDNHAIGLSHNDIMKKINYIHNNPVRAGLVDFPEHYVYSSARDFSGVKGLVNVTVV